MVCMSISIYRLVLDIMFHSFKPCMGWAYVLGEYVFAGGVSPCLCVVFSCMHECFYASACRSACRSERSALTASWQQANGEPLSSVVSAHRQGLVAQGYRVARGWMDRLASPECQLGMCSSSRIFFLTVLPFPLRAVHFFSFLFFSFFLAFMNVES